MRPEAMDEVKACRTLGFGTLCTLAVLDQRARRQPRAKRPHARPYGVVVIQALRTKARTVGAEGTLGEPGSKVRQ